nr:ribonuclease H-like domain, reverse transcriptase, RNA-dependent DNA polymerase [Tanacetum cinerariifolium]
MTLIEAARTVLVDSLLPISFWAEAVNTARYNSYCSRDLACDFLENKPNVASSGLTWLFDIDSLTRTMNYQPVNAENQPNRSASFQDKFDAEKAGEEIDQQYVLFPMWSSGSTNPQNNEEDDAFDGKEHDFDVKKLDSEVILSPSSKIEMQSLKIAMITALLSAAGPSNADVSPTYGKSSFIDASQLFEGPDMPELEDITYSDDENAVGAEADFNNLETSITVSPIPTTRIHKDHPVSQIIGDLSSTTQTRSMTRVVKDQGGLSQMFNTDFHTCIFACFLSQEEPKREGGIDYKEVFTPVARIEAIRLFVAYASFMGFMVYQMDVKSAFLYGTIKEEVYVCQPLGFEDPDHPDKVKQKKDGIFIIQDKYVARILRKFGLNEGKSASTLIDTKKPLLKDPDGKDVDVHTYRSMIGSLMYLTSSRLYIMFASLSAKCTSWNEFSSAMTSAAIYLSTGKGFLGVETPSFEGMVVSQVIEEGGTEEEHVEADTTAQGDDTTAHGDDAQEPSIPSPTPPTPPPQPPQDLPLKSQVQYTPPQSPPLEPQHQPQAQQPAIDFPMSLLQEALDVCDALTRRVEHLEYDKVAQALEITKLKRTMKKLENGNRVKVLKVRRLKRVRTSQRVNTSEDTVMDDASNQGRIIDEMDKDGVVSLMDDNEEDKKEEKAKEDEPAKVQEVVDVVTTAKLITEAVTTASETVTAASTVISAVEPHVLDATITAAHVRVATASTRRRKGVVIRDLEEESTTSSIIPADTKSKDKGKGIKVEEPKPLKKKQQVEMDEEYVRKLHAELNKDIE